MNDFAVQEWPRVLRDARAIAAHIESTASDEVDAEFVEEYYRGAGAVLRRVPIAELSEGNADGNQPSEAKERNYRELPLETMPPIICQGGVVEDGNHRLRIARSRGAADIWAYVVMDEEELLDQPECQGSLEESPSLNHRCGRHP